MNLNTKQKQRCLAFLTNMRYAPHLLPFSQKLQYRFGYSDFDLISPKHLDFHTIEKNLRNNKYPSTREFYRDLRRLFENYTLYVFDSDDICKVAKHCIKQIDDQEMLHHMPEFGEREGRGERGRGRGKEREREREREKKEGGGEEAGKEGEVVEQGLGKKSASFSEKLEMVYLLRAHERNFPEIQRLGETYRIGREYVRSYNMKLEGTNWVELLMKRTA